MDEPETGFANTVEVPQLISNTAIGDNDGGGAQNVNTWIREGGTGQATLENETTWGEDDSTTKDDGEPKEDKYDDSATVGNASSIKYVYEAKQIDVAPGNVTIPPLGQIKPTDVGEQQNDPNKVETILNRNSQNVKTTKEIMLGLGARAATQEISRKVMAEDIINPSRPEQYYIQDQPPTENIASEAVPFETPED